MRASACGILLAFIAWPVASAGSPERPEISDAAGDVAPPPPFPGAADLDLLAAWVNGSILAYNVTIRLAHLSPETSGTYRVFWTYASTEPHLVRGIRFTVGAGHVEAAEVAVSGFDGDSWDEEVEIRQPMSELLAGSPGLLVAHVAGISDLGFPPRYLFQDFHAFSAPSAEPNANFPVAGDRGDNPAAQYYLRLSPFVPNVDFEPPTRPPDLADESTNQASAGDLAGLWVDWDSLHVNLTVGVSNLTAASSEPCGENFVIRASLHDPSIEGQGGELFSTVEPFLNGADLQLDYQQRREPRVFGHLGAPGFVRFSFNATSWRGGTVVDALGREARVECGGTYDDARVDVQPVPSIPSAIVLLALGAAAAWGKRRRRA